MRCPTPNFICAIIVLAAIMACGIVFGADKPQNPYPDYPHINGSLAVMQCGHIVTIWAIETVGDKLVVERFDSDHFPDKKHLQEFEAWLISAPKDAVIVSCPAPAGEGI